MKLHLHQWNLIFSLSQFRGKTGLPQNTSRTTPRISSSVGVETLGEKGMFPGKRVGAGFIATTVFWYFLNLK